MSYCPGSFNYLCAKYLVDSLLRIDEKDGRSNKHSLYRLLASKKCSVFRFGSDVTDFMVALEMMLLWNYSVKAI